MIIAPRCPRQPLQASRPAGRAQKATFYTTGCTASPPHRTRFCFPNSTLSLPDHSRILDPSSLLSHRLVIKQFHGSIVHITLTLAEALSKVAQVLRHRSWSSKIIEPPFACTQPPPSCGPRSDFLRQYACGTVQSQSSLRIQVGRAGRPEF